MSTIQLTTHKVPISEELHDASGLPLVAVVQPLATAPEPLTASTAPALSDIARCSDCLGYMNLFNTFDKIGWACCMCGAYNDFANIQNHRYINIANRQHLPELQGPITEAFSPLNQHLNEDEDDGDNTVEVYESETKLVCIALVDTVCDEDFLDTVRSSILAGIESLPPGALFGLISFSDHVHLYEMTGDKLSVRHVPILTQGQRPTSVELSDALPLENLLIPVDAAGKAAIATALDGIHPSSMVHSSNDRMSPTSTNNNSSNKGVRTRPLGEALQATLRYIASVTTSAGMKIDINTGGTTQNGTTHTNDGGQQHYGSGNNSGNGAAAPVVQLGARLLVFLSGPPNSGRGSIFSNRKPTNNNTGNGGSSSGSGRNEAIPQYIFDPYFPELTAWNAVLPPPGLDGNNNEKENGVKPGDKSYIDLSHAATELSVEVLKLQRNPKAVRFYKEAASAAAALGVCVDVYAVSGYYVGFDMLRPISMRSGGGLVLYPSLEDCTLPQDVYKRLGEPLTMQCILRLRTSPELDVIAPMGERLLPDSTYDDLYHVSCCHLHDAFALELEHSKASGFASRSTPVLQLVFQYLVIVPGGGGGGDGHPKLVLQRRTRITTVAFPLTDSLTDLFNSCNAPAVTFALIQQLTSAQTNEDREETRLAMEEWLANLTAHYHDWVTHGEYDPALMVNTDSGTSTIQSTTSSSTAALGEQRSLMLLRTSSSSLGIDVAFTEVEALQPLPRAVYAIVKGPLLEDPGARVDGPHPDISPMLRTLCSTLPPEELAAVVYPQLSSWMAPDELAFPKHSLSKAAMRLSAQPVYLLDTYSSLVVFYTSTAFHRGLKFPPPQDSAIMRHVAAVRQARRVTPKVSIVVEGEEDAHVFTDWLIEDGSEVSGEETLLTFLEEIKKQAVEILESAS